MAFFSEEYRAELLDMDPEELVELLEVAEEELAHDRQPLPPELEEFDSLSRREMARRLHIDQRVRQHWRMLAVAAAMQEIGLEQLLAAAYQELIGQLPDERQVQARLEELVQRLEDANDPRVQHLRPILL